MPTSTWTRIVIALAAGVSAAIVWLNGGEVDSDLAKAVVTASSVVILLLLAWDRWLWRWPGIRSLHARPVLHGTWMTELRTTYAARAGSPIECFLVIEQTYSRICVRMLFDRSSSQSMSGNLVLEAGACRLYYVFRSDKHATQPAGNPPSRGAALLTIGRKPHLHLEGDYWMDVGTKGRVETTGCAREIFDTFSGAKSADYR